MGGGAAYLARSWLQVQMSLAAAHQPPGHIVIAAQSLPYGAAVTAENVSEIPWFTTKLPEGAFASKHDLLAGGRRTVLYPLKQGEPVLRSKVTGAGQRASLAAALEEGKRAVTVRVDDVRGVAGFVLPGDFVDIVMIADEVQSGMGRTGKMFAIEHFGVEPDMVAVAKGVASGLPLGVTTARASVMAWPPGAHASTFGGNPVSCVAALRTIELLKSSLMKNADDVGAFMLDRLRELQQKHQIIGDVRGRGLMIGIELVRDRKTKERAATERDKVVDACFARGLLVLGAGKNAIRLCPPLVLTREQAAIAVTILDEALATAGRA